MKLISRNLVDGLVTAVLLIAAGFVIYRNFPSSGSTEKVVAIPNRPLSLEGATVVGSRTAKVGLLVYTDFQCPFCKTLAQDIVPFVRQQYVEKGQVLLVLRHLPIARIHPFAFRAAEAAVCADRQGKFLSLHDALFQHQKELSEERIAALAGQSGLDDDIFAECMGGKAADSVKHDLASAQQLGITGTPTVFLGRFTSSGQLSVSRSVVGNKLSRQGWQEEIDAAIANETVSTSRMGYVVSALALMTVLGCLAVFRPWRSRRAAKT